MKTISYTDYKPNYHLYTVEDIPKVKHFERVVDRGYETAMMLEEIVRLLAELSEVKAKEAAEAVKVAENVRMIEFE